MTDDSTPAQGKSTHAPHGALTCIVRSVTDLVPYIGNSHTHSEAQVAQIAASIKEFGFTNPVLIDDLNMIIAGEGRVLAAKKLKIAAVPCVVLAGLTEVQKAAYVIADNKLVLNAGWDEDMLQAELSCLAGLNYDFNLTGFSEVEIAALVEDADADSEELAGDTVDTDTDTEETGEAEPTIKVSPTQPETAKPKTGQPEAQDAWQGMPEFNQPEAGPFRTINVHFKEQAAVDAFAKLIGQKLTDRTKWVWYPEVVHVAAQVVYA